MLRQRLLSRSKDLCWPVTTAGASNRSRFNASCPAHPACICGSPGEVTGVPWPGASLHEEEGSCCAAAFRRRLYHLAGRRGACSTAEDASGDMLSSPLDIDASQCWYSDTPD